LGGEERDLVVNNSEKNISPIVQTDSTLLACSSFS